MTNSSVDAAHEDQRRKILAILSAGASRQAAAAYAGWHHSRIGRIANRDPGFLRQLRRAERSAELLQLQNIRLAAEKTQYWRAAAWMLERLYPERYGKRKPRMFSYHDMEDVFIQFADLLSVEISDARQRRAVLRRVRRMISGFARGGRARKQT